VESQKQVYEVTIAGFPLKLRSSHDEETVQELVKIVDLKVNEVVDSNASVAFQKALLLSALHLAEELVLLKRSTLGELNHLENQAQKLLSDLEASPFARIRLDN
jgi:cell division protein ZapA